MGVNKRRFLKQLGIGTAALGSVPVASTAAVPDEPIEKIAVDVATNEDRNYLAFTAFESDTLCLYLAAGTASVDEPADEVVRLTNPGSGSVWSPRWTDPTALAYWQSGTVYERSLTADHTVGDRDVVETKLAPSGTQTGSGDVSPEMVIAPPGGGGGGDDPDWFDDPDYHHDPIRRCENVETLGIEWANFCIETTSVSPKYFTTSCTGSEMPLVGASVSSISITTPAGGGSLSLDLWMGVNPETGCLYWGSEAANVCISNCNLGLNPTLAEVEDAVMDDLEAAFDTVADEIADVPGLPWASYAETILKILAAIAALLFFILISIASGGSVAS